MLSRRKFLGLGAASLGSLAINPLDAFSWGAFNYLAPTHQLIADTAYNMLKKDILYFNNIVPFPEHQEVLKHDQVSINPTSMEHMVYGTGPDVEGRSPYSWHYWNPQKSWGKGPYAVAKHFQELAQGLHTNPKSTGTAKSASWMSHFIADMHGPYHVWGIPAYEAHRRNNARRYDLFTSESGPQYLFQLRTSPVGWGGNQNFQTAIQYFCESYPLKVNGKDNEVDWFDPWYYNGVRGARIGTGSHALWELDAHQIYWSSGRAVEMLNEICNRSYYDPLWKNAQVTFGDSFWKASSAQANKFADLCAFRTVELLDKIYEDALIGTVLAIRAVLTLFRASISALTFKIVQENQGNGYKKITAIAKNNNTYDTAHNVQLRLMVKRNGKWRGKAHAVGPIAKNSQKQTSWNIRTQAHKNMKAHLDVSGLYNITPDLGYNFKFFTISGSQEYIPEEPEPTPNYNCNVPTGARYFSNEYSEGYQKMINGKMKNVGPYKEWHGDDKKHIKYIHCYNKYGGSHGIQLWYKKDGSIGSKILYNNGYYVKEIKH